jgi:hypothetical protein
MYLCVPYAYVCAPEHVHCLLRHIKLYSCEHVCWRICMSESWHCLILCHTHAYARHTHTIYMYVCMYIYIYIYTYSSMWILVSNAVLMACSQPTRILDTTQTHTQIRTQTHTHTHTHTAQACKYLIGKWCGSDVLYPFFIPRTEARFVNFDILRTFTAFQKVGHVAAVHGVASS